MLGDDPGELQVGQLGLAGLTLGDDLPVVLVQGQQVPILDQHAADDVLEVLLAVAHAGQRAGLQQTDVAAPTLAGADGVDGAVFEARGDDDLGEEPAGAGGFAPALVRLDDRLGQLDRHRAVDGHDPAHRGVHVAEVRLAVGLDKIAVGRTAGRVGVLDDRHGRVGEVLDQLDRAVGVEVVVVGDGLAAEELRRAHARLGGVGADVEGGLLVGVLAVAEVGYLGVAEADPIRQIDIGLGVEVLADGGVVVGGQGERLAGELAPELLRDGAVVGPHLGEDLIVLAGIGDDGDELVVLGGGPDHAGPADVDHLDRVGEGAAFLGDRLLERVEADADQIQRLEAVLLDVRLVLRVVAQGQDRPVDLGVQGHHAVPEHLGKARPLLDASDGDAGGLDDLGGSAGGDDLHTHLGQGLGEVLDPGLVVHADQRPLDLHIHRHESLPPARGAAPGHPCQFFSMSAVSCPAATGRRQAMYPSRLAA